MLNKIKAQIEGKLTGFEPKIIIHLGVNAFTNKEAKEKAEQIKNIIEIKLSDYLKNFPYWIEIK